MMGNIGNFVRSLLPAFVTEASRRGLEKLDPFVRLSYSQDGEDMILRRIFEGRQIGFYVDVGAHHPFRFSNTCYFHRMGWAGLNIDADPAAIDAFRRARPSDTSVCVGVSDQSGELNFHFFDEPALNTFDASLADERAKLPGYRLVETRRIPVRRLDELLREYLGSERSIDFMSIDVEGMDLAVLRSNDWLAFRPRILLVEARDKSIAALETDDTNRFVLTLGYCLIAKTVNTLIYEDVRVSGRVPS